MRTWTLDEANAALAWVGECIERVRAGWAGAREARQQVASRARKNGRAASDERKPIREALEELMNEGIVVRDPERGLVDFPAVAPSGRPYWLCWVVGEPEVAWWHWQHEGFASRKPLSTPPT